MLQWDQLLALKLGYLSGIMIEMQSLKQIFLFIVLFTIIQRLYELRISHKNEKAIIANG